MRQLLSFASAFISIDDHSLALVWMEDSQVFRAEIPTRDFPPTDEHLNNAVGERIPDEDIFPPWCETFTEASQPLGSNIFVKKPWGAVISYSASHTPAMCVLADIKALEILSKRPHPNVNKYLGCIRNGDLVGGICLEKLDWTLYDLMKGKIPADQAPPFNPDVLISGIKAGIDHIHSFGLVHGDINPSNIMIDKAGNAIIIDFDNCNAVGMPCGPGTPGWMLSTKSKVSAFEMDDYGFDLVAKYIRGEYDGQDIHFGDSDDELEQEDPATNTESSDTAAQGSPPSQGQNERQTVESSDDRDHLASPAPPLAPPGFVSPDENAAPNANRQVEEHSPELPL